MVGRWKLAFTNRFYSHRQYHLWNHHPRLHGNLLHSLLHPRSTCLCASDWIQVLESLLVTTSFYTYPLLKPSSRSFHGSILGSGLACHVSLAVSDLRNEFGETFGLDWNPQRSFQTYRHPLCNVHLFWNLSWVWSVLVEISSSVKTSPSDHPSSPSSRPMWHPPHTQSHWPYLLTLLPPPFLFFKIFFFTHQLSGQSLIQSHIPIHITHSQNLLETYTFGFELHLPISYFNLWPSYLNLSSYLTYPTIYIPFGFMFSHSLPSLAFDNSSLA